jgi:hypothetical protein
MENEIVPPHDLPPGTYQIDEDGSVSSAVDWQQAVNKFKWENADQIIMRALGIKGDSEKLNVENSHSRRKHMTIVICVTIVVVGILTYTGQVPGEAFTGFLGVLIGHLLSKR